ncbi:MAG: hypothetical protein ABSC47_08730 [Terracidiphilus sp.]|jgi:hypothetical protein
MRFDRTMIAKLAPRELLRTARNAFMDFRFGGFSGGYEDNPVPGAYCTGATDYSLMGPGQSHERHASPRS